jgi:CspA family cold shock protein
MATNASVSNSTVTSCNERFTGRVKWFNNKAGYGFITVTDGVKAGSDIFVHHSSIKVDSDQYKYLVQGEYIEFSFSSVSSDKHEFQAGEVSGIKGGKLMCETRRELSTSRFQHKQEQGQDQQQVRVPRSVRPPVAILKRTASTDDHTAPSRQTTGSGRGSGGRGPTRSTGGRGGRGRGV